MTPVKTSPTRKDREDYEAWNPDTEEGYDEPNLASWADHTGWLNPNDDSDESSNDKEEDNEAFSDKGDKDYDGLSLTRWATGSQAWILCQNHPLVQQ
jgi:hypothetical protein